MADRTGVIDNSGAANPVTIQFAEKFTHSPQFMTVFHEGMNLVEETAAYLDGEGRTEARLLSRMGSLAYATESMRLTTRLMQLASWLLLHRAVNEGELTVEEARTEKRKVKLNVAASSHSDDQSYAELPERLRDLIGHSVRLHHRIVSLDAMIYAKQAPKEVVENTVQNHLGRIADAFEGSKLRKVGQKPAD
jgi:regulator of CtrA degradation